MRYNKHILLEGRVEDAKNFFKSQIGDSWPYTEEGNPYHHFLQGVNLEDRFNVFVENDPSSNNKYLKWMIDTYLGEHGLNPIDIYSAVQKFDVNLSRLSPEFMYNQLSVSPRVKKSPKDINSYSSLTELEFIVDELEKVATRKSKEKELKKDVDRVYEDDNWVIIRPKSHGASCYYGAGTKWCTTSKDKTFFEKYNNEGVLYYVIKKDSGPDYKIALYKQLPQIDTDYRTNRRQLGRVPDDQWYDMEDNPLPNRTSSMVSSMLPSKAIQVIDDLYVRELNMYKESLDFNQYKTLNQFTNIVTYKLQGQKIKFNTESGPWELEVVGRNEWYVSPVGDNKYKFSVDVFIDTEYEIIVSDFNGYIEPTRENDIAEDIGWYFRLLPGHIVAASNNLGYYEIDVRNTDGVELGLPSREIFKIRFLDNDKYGPRGYRGFPEKTFLNMVILPNLRYLLSRPEVKELTRKDNTVWKPIRSRTPLTFKYPPKEGSLTQLFIDFVKNNPGKTRKEFYDSIGRTYTPGHNSEFFSVINNSGIVNMSRKGRQFVYTLGPNYEPWTRGELARIKYR